VGFIVTVGYRNHFTFSTIGLKNIEFLSLVKIIIMILVIGATGLLGQEIVIQALEAGYEVKCLVRNINKSTNLRRFGAQLVYGDLSLPETIPRNLKGIKILIDASTLRLNATYHSEKLDWYGKLVLLKSAKIYKINRFIYFSFLLTKQSSWHRWLKANRRLRK